MMRRGVVLGYIVLAVALGACSSHASAAPRGGATSPYWIADPVPEPFHLAWADGDIFHYEQSPSGPSMNVITARRPCPDLSNGIGIDATKVNGHTAYEDADKDEGQAFGWSVEWEAAPSLCVEVVVDNMQQGVPAAHRLARQVAPTVRPTTYAYFRSVCARRLDGSRATRNACAASK